MILNRHKSTISREVRRNTSIRGYRPKQTQRLADQRKDDKVWATVVNLIRQQCSPEQVSHWSKVEHSVLVSYEWIYHYILQDKLSGGDLYLHLRCQKQCRKRYGNYNRRGQIVDRVSIKEFVEHKTIVQTLKADFYFAHPYASWERGLNESTNGLIRQYLPKNRDLTTGTQKEIYHVMSKLNNRPRKGLGIKTPNQALLGIDPTIALAS